jgi:hypothetical protein
MVFRRSLFTLFASAFALFLSFAPATPAFAAQTQPGLTFPIDTTGTTGKFTGVLRITSFAVQNNALVATGMVTGTTTTASGTTSVARTVTIPVATSGAGRSVAAD